DGGEADRLAEREVGSEALQGRVSGEDPRADREEGEGRSDRSARGRGEAREGREPDRRPAGEPRRQQEGRVPASRAGEDGGATRPPGQDVSQTTPTEVHIGGKRLKLSNLDKVLYPEVGFTKAEVI